MSINTSSQPSALSSPYLYPGSAAAAAVASGATVQNTAEASLQLVTALPGDGLSLANASGESDNVFYIARLNTAPNDLHINTSSDGTISLGSSQASLLVDGATGKVTAAAALSVGGTLVISGAATFSQTIQVVGALSASALSAATSVTAASIVLPNAPTFTGTLTDLKIPAVLNLASALTVQSLTSGNVTATSVSVPNANTFTGNLTDLKVQPATSLATALTATSFVTPSSVTASSVVLPNASSFTGNITELKIPSNFTLPAAVTISNGLVTTTGSLSGNLSVGGTLTSGAISAPSTTLTGALNAFSAVLSGAVTAASATLTGALTAASATVNTLNGASLVLSGSVTAASGTITTLSGTSQTLSGALNAASATLTGALNAASVSITNAVSAASLTVSGSITAASGTVTTLSGTTQTLSGALNAASATLTGALNAASATITNAVSAASLTVSGSVTAASGTITTLSGTTHTLSGVLSAASATLTGALNAASASITNAISAASLTVTGAVTAAKVVLPNAANLTGIITDLTMPATFTIPSQVTLSNGTITSNIQTTGTSPMVQCPGNIGDFISTNFSTTTGDRYGFGQYANGVTRCFASSPFAPAKICLSFATNAVTSAAATFTDVLAVSQNPNTVTVNGVQAVTGALTAASANVSGNVTAGSINSSGNIVGPVVASTLSAPGGITGAGLTTYTESFWAATNNGPGTTSQGNYTTNTVTVPSGLVLSIYENYGSNGTYQMGSGGTLQFNSQACYNMTCNLATVYPISGWLPLISQGATVSMTVVGNNACTGNITNQGTFTGHSAQVFLNGTSYFDPATNSGAFNNTYNVTSVITSNAANFSFVTDLNGGTASLTSINLTLNPAAGLYKSLQIDAQGFSISSGMGGEWVFNTSYSMAAGQSYTPPSSSWTVVSTPGLQTILPMSSSGLVTLPVRGIYAVTLTIRINTAAQGGGENSAGVIWNRATGGLKDTQTSFASVCGTATSIGLAAAGDSVQPTLFTYAANTWISGYNQSYFTIDLIQRC